MDIVLLTNSVNPALAFRNCEKFGDHSGYRVDLSVTSGGFALEIPFFFEEWPLQQFVSSLSEIQANLSGKATLTPMWEDDFIEFQVDNLGHVTVIGEFAEHTPIGQKLRFGFETDQTCLAPFRDELVRLEVLQSK